MTGSPSITLNIRDLTPDFLSFYDAATRASADEEERWRLWNEHYGVAAVPPTPERSERARALLDGAWTRYPDVLEIIRAGAEAIAPEPEPILHQVVDLLGCTSSVTINLVVFVGAFDDNPFSFRHDGVPTIFLPVEQSSSARALTTVHEFTHAVQMTTANLSGEWERSIAEIVMNEGLATHATSELVPERSPHEYVGSKRWFLQCQERQTTILEGIQPFLASEDSDTISHFYFGEGTTGLTREAYFTGWVVVGHLLESGMSFPSLAHVGPDDMVELIHSTIITILEPTA